MITDKLKEIEDYKNKIASLEGEVQSALKAELAGLPGKYGFATPDDFIAAVRDASTKRRSGPRAKKASNGGTRKRAKITPEIEQKVKELVEAGKTGSEIAAEVGVSMPSVQNIKKKLGLVNAR